jgi:hypothetical protein
MEDDWDDSVSMRLACLALHKGRLTDDLVTALAVRGALLTDLTLQGRLIETVDAVEFDQRPTGFAPADRLIASGASSVVELLRTGRVNQDDLAIEHLRRGTWTRRHRFLPRRYIDHRADRTELDEHGWNADKRREGTATDAALIAIGGILGLLANRRSLPTEELLSATGQARGLVELTVGEVNQRMVQGRAVFWAQE